jgi:hypothetical protein
VDTSQGLVRARGLGHLHPSHGEHVTAAAGAATAAATRRDEAVTYSSRVPQEACRGCALFGEDNDLLATSQSLTPPTPQQSPHVEPCPAQQPYTHLQVLDGETCRYGAAPGVITSEAVARQRRRQQGKSGKSVGDRGGGGVSGGGAHPAAETASACLPSLRLLHRVCRGTCCTGP